MKSRSLELRPAGLYCPPGDFYVDPWQPVDRAVITHAHSDHARWGSRRYLCSNDSVQLLKDRLGSDVRVTGLAYNQPLKIGSVSVSIHPAGHILGSGQIRIENQGHVTVVTGDFKREPDRTCTAFEPIRAHDLVTESTFGLPIFNWPEFQKTGEQINRWWRVNQENGLTSILYGYALGKSQRILSMLDPSIGPIFIHGALQKPNEAYRCAGIELPTAQLISQAPPGTDWSKAIVLAVPSAHGTTWLNRFRNRSTALASGWTQVRGNRRRRAVDRGFVVSDHADWSGLLRTVHDVQPESVFVTHGFAEVLSRHLCDLGINAASITTRFVGESTEGIDDQETVVNDAVEGDHDSKLNVGRMESSDSSAVIELDATEGLDFSSDKETTS